MESVFDSVFDNITVAVCGGVYVAFTNKSYDDMTEREEREFTFHNALPHKQKQEILKLVFKYIEEGAVKKGLYLNVLTELAVKELMETII